MVVLFYYLNKRQKNEKGRMQIGRMQMLRLKNILIMLFAAVITAGSVNAATLLWSDEFDGTAVDTSKWAIYNKADGTDSWFAPANVTVSGGTLKIANKEETIYGGHWSGGGIESKYYPQYVYLESRIRHSAHDTCIWATWWTVGWKNGALVWPPEFDICEFQGPASTSTNKTPGQWYHYLTSSGNATYKGASTTVDESQWHTYGVSWNATDSPIFYVDGVVSDTPGLGSGSPPAMPMKFKLTSSPNSGTRVSGVALGTMEVDYVRVYDVPPGAGNVAPTVSITAPANGATYTAPASVVINATAADSDGSVSKVDFYQGSTLLGTDMTSPYTYTWSNVAAGSYSLTADATDNDGAVTTSSAVGITVTGGGGNVAPTVSITAPANGATYTAPATVVINATAADSDGTVSKVDFYQGSTLLGTDTTSPYSYTWTNVAAGSYSLTADATDNGGATTTSAAVGITVTGGTPVLLSQGKAATASSEENSSRTAAKGNDGDTSTRWGASSSAYPQWWRVDLGASHALTRMDITWLNGSSRSYKYKIEVSTDGTTYTTVVDQSGRTANGNTSDSFTATARYVRVTVTGSSSGWASAYEFKVYGN
jgi:hypothetical protein